MAADRLRRLVDAFDRANARPNRLEPERLTMAPRAASEKREVCLGCRRPRDQAMVERHQEGWLAANPIPEEFAREGEWGRGRYMRRCPPIDGTCPFCGGVLVGLS